MKRKEVDDVLEEGEGKGMDIADGAYGLSLGFRMFAGIVSILCREGKESGG